MDKIINFFLGPDYIEIIALLQYPLEYTICLSIWINYSVTYLFFLIGISEVVIDKIFFLSLTLNIVNYDFYIFFLQTIYSWIPTV